jgi:hypothetical protein
LKRILKSISAVLLLGIAPTGCFACEPIVPMAMLYSGTTLFGAIALKSGIGLLLAVLVKCLVFYWKSDFKNVRAISYMILANVYSTIPGILLGITFSVPMLILLAYPILLIPSHNMKEYRPFRRLGTFGSAGVLFVLLVISFIVFLAAMGAQEGPAAGYWSLKVLYCILAVGISFIISVVCEDRVITYFYTRKYKTQKSFLDAVLWANIAVFLVIFGIGAAIALPQRLASPNFLIGP